MKAEAALLIALADIGGVWQVMQVTRALTELADGAVWAAVRFLLDDAGAARTADARRSRAPEKGSGYFVLAMGKMGAFELNYSSDIDLIVFFDPDAPALASTPSRLALYVRMTRGLVKLLQERTADGYVFRVDLRLRPDPASTQIAVSTPAALEYYEQRGQNWERSAMIKARVCAGDIAAGDELLDALSPFIWRKYMDFAALADIHAMKRQIHAYRGHGEIAVAGHNIKLGRGGIREIEFFVQTQQLIAGGRHPELRDRATLATLRCAGRGRLDRAEAAQRDLEAAYHFLRQVEHRLQMVADEQTHTLPSDRGELSNASRAFSAMTTRDAFAADAAVRICSKVQRHYSQLFEHVPAQSPDAPARFPEDADDRETLDRLSAMGFRNPLEVSGFGARLARGHISRAAQRVRARRSFAELVPAL